MPLLPFLMAYLFLGLLFYGLTRWVDGPQGVGGFIGYTVTGPLQFVFLFVLVIVGLTAAGVQWVGERL